MNYLLNFGEKIGVYDSCFLIELNESSGVVFEVLKSKVCHQPECVLDNTIVYTTEPQYNVQCGICLIINLTSPPTPTP